jgi:hypothetical protein
MIPYYSLMLGVDGLTSKETFERLQFLVSTKIPDVTEDEIVAAADLMAEGHEFDV